MNRAIDTETASAQSLEDSFKGSRPQCLQGLAGHGNEVRARQGTLGQAGDTRAYFRLKLKSFSSALEMKTKNTLAEHHTFRGL